MGYKLLVVGAGPVGLAGALFCRQENNSVKVVEKLQRPIKESKALAVNPRSLELLESSGITEQMLELGLKIKGAKIWREDGSLAAEISFKNLHPRYPFMLALSQAVTERLLSEALAKQGVEVHRGLEVVACENYATEVRTNFKDESSMTSEYVFAADGAHSTVRTSAKIPFSGSSFPGEWYLADVALKTLFSEEFAHVVFLDAGGFYFMVPVIEDIRQPLIGDRIWRVISSQPDPLKNFRYGHASADPVWSSDFNVSHRICKHLRDGRIFLAGDAAHLHSPAGARGMNLGIEDAWVFASLLKENKLDQYDLKRQSVDSSVVHSVDLLSRLAMGDHAYLRALRRFILPEALKISSVRQLLSRSLSGLDHQVMQ